MAEATPPTKQGTQGTPWSPPDSAPTYPGIENNPPKKPTSRRENGDSGDDDNTKRAIDMDAETERGASTERVGDDDEAGAPGDPSRDDADVAETPRGAAHASEQTLRPATSKKRPGRDGLHGPPDAAKKRKSGDRARTRHRKRAPAEKPDDASEPKRHRNDAPP